MVWYLDSSAALKLVVRERGSAALRRWIAPRRVVSSELLRTEVLRATRRQAPHAMQQAQHLIESLDLLELTADTFARAALLDPPSLRSLDALHLAAALTFGDDLGGMVVYDERLAAAARDRGIEVVAPS